MSDSAVTRFTDQKPRFASEQEIHGNWGGGKDGKYFRCYLCGYKFKLGDYWRWVYTNSTPGAGGNPSVCERCDEGNERVIEKWIAMIKEANERFWWFTEDRDRDRPPR